MPDLVAAGREAIARHDWEGAVDALGEADRSDGLSGDDLALLGDAYWWIGRPDDAVAAYERAFTAFESEGRVEDAAIAAAVLTYFALRRMATSVAGGWFARVERLLADRDESGAHAWLSMLRTATALMGEGDLDKGIALADDTIGIAQRQDVPGIQSLAMSFKGFALVQKGEWRAGMALVDEAAAFAMSQESDLRATSDVYCNTIAACSSLADYRRAGEWTDEAERWMAANSLGGYTGVCQVHRAELKRLRGSWSEAEEVARRACVELERFHLLDGIGWAYYEIGEVRRRMGDWEASEKAFLSAYEYGHHGQPGFALLRFDQGRLDEAADMISRGIDGFPIDAERSAERLSRAQLLPAQVEIALARADTATADRAATELEDVAARYDGASWQATALTSRGAVQIAAGDHLGAVASLERAWRLWRDIDLPYEGARARTLLGQARRAAGDEAGAMLEFRSALSALSDLGATTDVARLGELTGGSLTAGAGERRRVTKTFMFTDIVTSTDLIGLIGDEAWEDLLAWHDRALREGIAANGGQEVRHTGDGFFVTFDSARSAIECAVAIQRRLEAHRRDSGFAPWVRIGLHVAEATRQGSDYSGQGVHEAARIGSLAEREEIVVSASVLEAAGKIPFPVSEGRQADLKGISEPVTVHSVDWR